MDEFFSDNLQSDGVSDTRYPSVPSPEDLIASLDLTEVQDDVFMKLLTEWLQWAQGP